MVAELVLEVKREAEPEVMRVEGTEIRALLYLMMTLSTR